MISGRYPNQNNKHIPLGLEFSGIDTETNRPVMALLSNGSYSEYVWAPASQIMPVPKNIEVSDAQQCPRYG